MADNAFSTDPPPTTVLCDLDGVVWLANRAIDGAPEAIERLRADHIRVLFVTNNSYAVVRDQEAALARIGVPAGGDVLTSAQAAAQLVEPGERVLVCGGPGVYEAVSARGATPIRDGAADVVMVGMHRDFDYERMRIASTAIRAGSRFIGTNDDATYPTPDGPIPGGGSIVAAVATAAGVEPVIAGKPYEPMAALVRAAVGADFAAARTVMVGDRFSTDGVFARTLGCRFALVRSGVTLPGAMVDGVVDLDAADLAAVTTTLLRRPGQR